MRTIPVTEEVPITFHAIKLWVEVTYIKGDDSYFEVDNITTRSSAADRALAEYFDENLLLIRDEAYKTITERSVNHG